MFRGVSAEAVLAAARLMWPSPAAVDVHGAGVPVAAVDDTAGVDVPAGEAGRRLQYYLVPSAAAPKLVVPAGWPAAAARAARSATAPSTAVAAARTATLAAGLRCGAAAVLLRDRLTVELPAGGAGIDEHLGELVGRQVLIGFRVGPPRANRKPVMQLLTPRGELVGYAKLGVNALTDTLVAAEGQALARLAGADLGDVQIPVLLHSGSWQGHSLVIQSALPVRRTRRGAAASRRVDAAMWAVAAAEGLSRVALAELPWWKRTCHQVAALPASGAGQRLAAIGQALGDYGDSQLLAGAWHGDWNPGNCAVVGREVLLWDWERYETGVPVGFDALHLSLQTAIGAGVDPLAAAGRLLTDAAALLAGARAGDHGRLVAMLYLYGLGARYLHDDQAGAGASVGRLEGWLLPTLEQACAAAQADRPAAHLAEKGD